MPDAVNRTPHVASEWRAFLESEGIDTSPYSDDELMDEIARRWRLAVELKREDRVPPPSSGTVHWPPRSDDWPPRHRNVPRKVG